MCKFLHVNKGMFCEVGRDYSLACTDTNDCPEYQEEIIELPEEYFGLFQDGK